MERNFSEALAHTLQFEGGWDNNPNDPGGATMKGITLRTLARFLQREVTQEELHAVSDAEVADVYHALYWAVCECALLPDGLDFAVFDTAVNTGPGGAVLLLQRIVGVTADGVGQIARGLSQQSAA